MATDPTWTDIGIFWATVGGVTATFAAVLAALFGQRLHEARRRPKLSVTTDPEKYAIKADQSDVQASDKNAQVLHLRIFNEPGRDTARDVEVFVDAAAETSSITLEAADAANLNFDDPVDDSGPGRATATVPSGYARRVNLAVLTRLLAEDLHLHIEEDPQKRQWHQAWGHLAVYPPRLAGEATLYGNAKYDVRITVTGANFDAITYQGALEVKEDHEPGVGLLKSFNWVEPLKVS